MTKRIVIQCAANPRKRWRHQWGWVTGTMATQQHPYIERKCALCGIYESEVR